MHLLHDGPCSLLPNPKPSIGRFIIDVALDAVELADESQRLLSDW